MKNDSKRYVKLFVGYYKPHIKPFIFDILCAVVVALCNVVYPRIGQSVFNDYIGDYKMIGILCSVMLVVFIVKAIFNYLVEYHGHIIGVKMQQQMRKELFAHLQKLPIAYYDETSSGSIISRLVNDLFEVSELAHHGPENLFISGISFIGAVIAMFTIHPLIAIVVGVVLPIMIFIIIKMRSAMLKAFRVSRERTAEINSQVENAVLGIKVSKAYNAEEFENEKFGVYNDNYRLARQGVLKIMGRFHSVMQFCLDILYLLVILLGAILCAKGKISDGDLAGIILYVSMLISPIKTFVNLIEQVTDGMVGFRRFIDMLDISPEPEPVNPVHVNKLKGDILYDNVSFNYDSGSMRKIITDLTLKIDSGEVVAFVGPSGGGKTTLCNLLSRFYELKSGRITIDGIDIKDIPLTELRANIGTVAQDTFLFSGTVKENIAYGKLDATDEEIVSAARLAGVDEFTRELPDGYDTYIGERGTKLSGGQRQRISIARAFLKNPPILILDEATSSLDNVTEMQIQKSLEELKKGRTTIIVAHRLSTVVNADEIIVFTRDGVCERGTHKQLLEKNGLYAHLYAHDAWSGYND